MKNIGVTGSRGFIGQYLVSALISNGYNVIELDLKNGYDLTKVNPFENIESIDYLIHLASKSFVPDSFENPYSFYYENYMATLNVLEYARIRKIKVLYFSSYLYGVPMYLPIDELHPLAPHNPYSQTKLICEKLCEGYNRDFGLDVIIFRPFNIYGKGQNISFLLPSILQQFESGIIKLKDPRPKRDFIHVNDVISAVLNAIKFQPTGYMIFNIGYGKSYSISELTNIISEIKGHSIEVEFTHEYRKGEVLDTIANINRAKNILMWEPKIDLITGLKQIINNYVNKK